MPGANDQVVVALIGAGGQGRYDLRAFMKNPEVQVAAVCDVNQEHLAEAVKMTGGTAQPYADFRQVIERKDIDAVLVGTPDHWHALPAIYACQAGKDVYVEKPLALCIREQQRMVHFARENKRIVQVGTQQRSGKHFQTAVKLVRDGKLGKVSFVRCWNYDNNYPEGMGNPPDTDPPSTLDWDFWLGPAPRVRYNKNRAAGTFRWFWDYAGGKITDWGTHLIDIVQWAMDVKGPAAVSASGSKFYIEDNRETPDTLSVVFEYPRFLMSYESRELNERRLEASDYGIEFHGTEGTLFLTREGWEVFPEYERDKGRDFGTYTARTPVMKSGSSDQHAAHVRNFLDCIRNRELPNSDIETGHRSTTAPHLANIALRTGQKVFWDPETEELKNGTKEQHALLARSYRAPWVLP